MAQSVLFCMLLLVCSELIWLIISHPSCMDHGEERMDVDLEQEHQRTGEWCGKTKKIPLMAKNVAVKIQMYS
jgi:hypothetical protein